MYARKCHVGWPSLNLQYVRRTCECIIFRVMPSLNNTTLTAELKVWLTNVMVAMLVTMNAPQ